MSHRAMVRVAPVAGRRSGGAAPVRDGGDAAQTARGRTQRDPGTARSGFRRIVRSRSSCRLRSRRLRLPSNGACGGDRGNHACPECHPKAGLRTRPRGSGPTRGCNRLPSRFILLCKVRGNPIPGGRERARGVPSRAGAEGAEELPRRASPETAPSGCWLLCCPCSGAREVFVK